MPLAIIGGGPAGLMAAEIAARAGVPVDLFDAMPSPGRKFLVAGKGGLNITHAEPATAFLARYGRHATHIAPLLAAFGPEAIRAWMAGLGIDSRVGSSGRVFPSDMKAAPLLRAWLHRLREYGVRIHVRHRWIALEKTASGNYRLALLTPDGEIFRTARTVVLALGGGSWPRLGSDGTWVSTLGNLGIPVAPLRPANCGFDANWSPHLRERFAGHPVKNVAAACKGPDGTLYQQRGELILTRTGVEGGLIYAFSAPLRNAIESTGSATLHLNLLPDHCPSHILDAVTHPRGARSLSSHLQSRLGLKGAKMALLREILPPEVLADPVGLASAIQSLPLQLVAPRPLAEAISSAGGVCFEALDEHLMLRNLPGVFCAGEMLDWEAPTGGYLLTGCLASGHAAGEGALSWLRCAR